MKRAILLGISAVVLCLTCCLVAYRSGFARAKQLQKGTFVTSFEVLEKLRSGNISEATRATERLCFSAAAMLYSDPSYDDQVVTRAFASELIRYRSAYRSNSNEWTTTEKELDKNLEKYKH